MPQEVPKIPDDNVFLQSKKDGISAEDAARGLINTMDATLQEFVTVYDRAEIEDNSVEFNLIAVIVAVRNAQMALARNVDLVFSGSVDEAPEAIRDLIIQMSGEGKLDVPEDLLKALGHDGNDGDDSKPTAD